MLIAYDEGDEPEEEDDEVRDSCSDEEGEEEAEDILIVEADEYPDQGSPEIKPSHDSRFSQKTVYSEATAENIQEESESD